MILTFQIGRRKTNTFNFFNFCAQISPNCKQKIQPFFFFFLAPKILKVRSKLIPKWNENPRLTIWRNLVRQFSIFAYIADFEVSRSTLWVFLTHPLSLSSSWLNLQNRIDYGLNFTLLPKVGWNIQNSFKNANKKKIPLDIVFVNNFCGSGELGRRANVSKLKTTQNMGTAKIFFSPTIFVTIIH